MPAQPQVQSVVVSPSTAGQISIIPPTFLERWGVAFVATAGSWMLLVGSGLLIYYFSRQPGFPITAGLTPDQIRDVLASQKQASDQLHDSIGYVFYLLVTKTALPLVTLLLGYLFGKKS